jgi:DNA-binding response OmpR family regulator
LRVLLVSDDPRFRQDFHRALEDSAAVASVHAVGSDDDSMWDDPSPDVVLLDASRSLVEALAERARPDWGGTVTVIVADALGADARALGEETGAAGYLKRQVDMPVLLEAVIALVAIARAT